jgi:hypothetical protein
MTNMLTFEEVRHATIESMNLVNVNISVVSLFTNLSSLELGDNNLRVEFFASLPALRELRLPCNNIKYIEKIDSGFPELQVRN